MLVQAPVFETYLPAKEIPDMYDIFFVSSRHVECIVKIEKK
ncbi:hypothetical protein CBB_3137 [Clostridium botulinum Bf]|uniref:Uncharacterized protein n=1 Tax=Clostridium botulinum (strain 657 / Type Ba4) TaxID=515621 RepID=A0A3F2ZUP9_CLOB6|nr:hypothetical protein CLJ_B3099 [Clostridium botulinum Ba4 str. 657]EDT84387.1 hypothetical protein CBB_3137 [Clostridium botulinum Bf]